MSRERISSKRSNLNNEDNHETPILQNIPRQVFIHDLFNIISLTIMIPIIVLYCCRVTECDKIGTLTLGSGHEDLFLGLFSILMTYLIVDTISIYLYPSCVVTPPQSLIWHHCLLIPLCLVPFFYKQYHWHMMIGLLGYVLKSTPSSLCFVVN